MGRRFFLVVRPRGPQVHYDTSVLPSASHPVGTSPSLTRTRSRLGTPHVWYAPTTRPWSRRPQQGKEGE